MGLTLIESYSFARDSGRLWSQETRNQFLLFLSQNPNAGMVMPGSGGLRKLRWSLRSSGKRGGVRVIYFNRLNRGEIWLLAIYAKGDQETITSDQLKGLKDALKDL
jgi:hypothetical protein